MRAGFVLLTVCFLFFCTASQCKSEFFRYKDQNGNLRYTDDFAAVPSDQIGDVKSYSDEYDNLTPEERIKREEEARLKREQAKQAENNTKEKDSQQKSLNNDDKDTKDEKSKKEQENLLYKSELAELKEIKKGLTEEYDLLMKDIAELKAKQNNQMRSPELRKYRTRHKELESRISAFETRNADYQQKLADFKTRYKINDQDKVLEN